MLKPDDEPVGMQILPDVVVTSYLNNGTFQAHWYYYLSGFMDITDEGWGYGIYGIQEPSGNGSTNAVQQDQIIDIDFDDPEKKETINIDDFLKCFGTLSDAGSTCTLTIYTDITVDIDPNKLFDWDTQSPGHNFLQIKKVGSGQIIQQNIGFYPDQGWKTVLTPGPLPGKFVDDGSHEFNASLQMNISPAQLQTVITKMQYLSRFVRYDIDDYNCTDFALEVFNSVRTVDDELVIPKYQLPGSMSPEGSSTPEGVYNKLKSMVATKGPETEI